MLRKVEPSCGIAYILFLLQQPNYKIFNHITPTHVYLCKNVSLSFKTEIKWLNYFNYYFKYQCFNLAFTNNNITIK